MTQSSMDARIQMVSAGNANSKKGVYHFDSVKKRQDSQYFDRDMMEHKSVPLDAEDDEAAADANRDMMGRGSLPLDAEDEEATADAATKEPQEVSDKKKSSEGTFTRLRKRVSPPSARGNTVIRSMSTMRAVKRRAKRKKHVRRELGKSERRNLHEKEMEMFIRKENEIFQHVYQATWKKNILRCFESSLVEILMVLFTIFALYGSDLADAFWTAESDPFVDAAIWVVMILFFVENICLA